MATPIPVASNAVTPRNRRRLPVGGWELALFVLLALVLAGFSLGAPGFFTDVPGLLIIVRLGVEPLIATLGTSFIYTSAAVAAAGNAPPSGFPDAFNALGSQALGVAGVANLLPFQLLLFAGLVVAFWLLVGRSAFGRKLVTVGYNVEAARYSGIRVNRILVAAYVISGAMASLAGLVLAAYYDAVRPDMGDVLLLTTITMVVLGGVSIFGGEGTIPGVVLAVLLLGFLRQGMLIAGFSDMVTTMLTGAILLASIAIKNLANPRGGGLSDDNDPGPRADHTPSEETRMAKILHALTGTALALALGLGAAHAQGAAPDISKRIKVAMVPKLVGLSVFKANEQGAIAAAKALNVDFLYTGPVTASAQGQVDTFNSLIARKFDVITTTSNNPRSPSRRG